jgi:hypothetical protein
MILILARGKLTYYEEIKDQLHDTNKDDISKADDISVEVKTEPDDFEEEELNKDMNDISVEVDDFKVSNEALENQVEVCNNEKVKTEPDEFEDEDKKPLEDIVEGERFNAYDVEKVKTQHELQIWF